MESAPQAIETPGSRGGLAAVPMVRVLQAGVALAMLLGYLVTASFFSGHLARDYALLSLVSILASIPLVASGTRDGPARIFRVMVLVVFFVGYYGQFYWLIADPTVETDLAEVMTANLHPEAMLDVFRETTWSFAGFALVSLAMDRIPWNRRPAPPVGPAAARRIGVLALGAAFALTAVILPVMAFESIAVMAAKGPELPFRIAGWMVYGLRMLVPGLFLLAIAMGERVRNSRMVLVAIAGLVLAGAGDMLVTTSKASLALAFVRILLLLFLLGTLTRARLQLAAVAIVVMAALFPFFSALRMARFQGLSTTEAVREAREDRGRDDSPLSRIRPAVLRVSGANTLLPLIALDPIPAVAAAGFVTPVGISAYITVAVYGHQPGAPAAEAPGLLGWFHLALGKQYAFVGVLLLLVALELLWRVAWVLPLLSREVVLALLGGFLLTVVTDGVIESIGLPLLVIAGTTVAVEVLARVGARIGRGDAPEAQPSGSDRLKSGNGLAG